MRPTHVNYPIAKELYCPPIKSAVWIEEMETYGFYKESLKYTKCNVKETGSSNIGVLGDTIDLLEDMILDICGSYSLYIEQNEEMDGFDIYQILSSQCFDVFYKNKDKENCKTTLYCYYSDKRDKCPKKRLDDLRSLVSQQAYLMKKGK